MISHKGTRMEKTGMDYREPNLTNLSLLFKIYAQIAKKLSTIPHPNFNMEKVLQFSMKIFALAFQGGSRLSSSVA